MGPVAPLTPPPELEEIGSVAAFRADLARAGRRGTLIGAAVGVGIVLLVGVALAVVTAVFGSQALDPGETLRLVLQALVIVGVSSMLGRMIAALPISHRLRDLAGGPGTARRTGRVVFKGASPADEAEAERARRYAPYAAVALRAQGLTLGLFYGCIIANSVLQTFNATAGLDELRTFQVAIVAGLVIVACVALPLQVQRIHRAETYARSTGNA